MKPWSFTKNKIRRLRVLWIVVLGIIGGLFLRHYEIATTTSAVLGLQKSLGVIQTTSWIDSNGASRISIVVEPQVIEGTLNWQREQIYNYIEDDLATHHNDKWDFVEIISRDKSYSESSSFRDIIHRALKRRHKREKAWRIGDEQWRNNDLRVWTFIDIHHSATRGGSLAAFDKVHRKRKMNNGVAYHFVIGNGNGIADGEVEVSGRWHRQIGSGATKDDFFNNSSIAICLVGDFTKKHPTSAQMDSLTRLIKTLTSVYNIPIERVLSHQRIRKSSTLCPGKNFDMQNLVERLGFESQGEFNTSQVSPIYK